MPYFGGSKYQEWWFPGSLMGINRGLRIVVPPARTFWLCDIQLQFLGCGGSLAHLLLTLQSPFVAGTNFPRHSELRAMSLNHCCFHGYSGESSTYNFSSKYMSHRTECPRL